MTESYFDRQVFNGLAQLCERTRPGGFSQVQMERIIPELEGLSKQVAENEKVFLQSYSALAAPNFSDRQEEKKAFLQFSRQTLALKKAQIEVLELKLSFYEKFYS